MIFFLSKICRYKILRYLCIAIPERKSSSKRLWEFSSAGLEHLPYKQRVGGSNPSTPTLIRKPLERVAFVVDRGGRIYSKPPLSDYMTYTAYRTIWDLYGLRARFYEPETLDAKTHIARGFQGLRRRRSRSLLS